MKIDFDPDKNERNIQERQLSFERVEDFDFATAAIHKDTRKIYPETRLIACGFIDERLHILCFTPITEGIRIISFRKANRREEKNYEQATTHD